MRSIVLFLLFFISFELVAADPSETPEYIVQDSACTPTDLGQTTSASFADQNGKKRPCPPGYFAEQEIPVKRQKVASKDEVDSLLPVSFRELSLGDTKKILQGLKEYAGKSIKARRFVMPDNVQLRGWHHGPFDATGSRWFNNKVEQRRVAFYLDACGWPVFLVEKNDANLSEQKDFASARRNFTEAIMGSYLRQQGKDAPQANYGGKKLNLFGKDYFVFLPISSQRATCPKRTPRPIVHHETAKAMYGSERPQTVADFATTSNVSYARPYCHIPMPVYQRPWSGQTAFSPFGYTPVPFAYLAQVVGEDTVNNTGDSEKKTTASFQAGCEDVLSDEDDNENYEPLCCIEAPTPFVRDSYNCLDMRNRAPRVDYYDELEGGEEEFEPLDKFLEQKGK